MENLKECEWCGNKFEPYRPNAKYCCKECKRLASKKRNANKKYKVEECLVVKKYPEKNKELVEKATEARKAGMTYGQYVGMLYLQKGASR